MDLEDINEEIQRFTHRPRELVNHILKELRLIKKTFVSEGNPSLAKKTWIYRMIFLLKCSIWTVMINWNMRFNMINGLTFQEIKE